MRLRYKFLLFLVWLVIGLVLLFLQAYFRGVGEYELAYLLAGWSVIILGMWVFVGLPAILIIVFHFLHISARAHKTPKSFLKECPKCGKKISIASEECPFCKAKQE